MFETLDARLRPWLGWLLPTLGIVLAVVLAAAVAFLGLQVMRTPSPDALDQIRGESLKAGRSAAKTLLSYDYRTLDKDFAAGRRVATGTFERQYARTTSRTVTPSAKKYHVTVTAQVVAGSVVSTSRDRVVLLLYVNQDTVSDLVKNGRLDQNRVEMTMVPVDGHWRVSELKSL